MPFIKCIVLILWKDFMNLKKMSNDLFFFRFSGQLAPLHGISQGNGRFNWQCPSPLQITWQVVLGYMVLVRRKDPSPDLSNNIIVLPLRWISVLLTIIQSCFCPVILFIKLTSKTAEDNLCSCWQVNFLLCLKQNVPSSIF